MDIVVNGIAERLYEIKAYSQDPAGVLRRTDYMASIERDMKLKKFNRFHESAEQSDLNLELLDSFTKNYSEFSTNLSKSKMFLEQFEAISEELKLLVKKDEFEGVLASHIIVINDAIDNIKNSIQKVKQENVTAVNENAKSLGFKLKEVVDLINEEVKNQKKYIIETTTKQKTLIDNLVNKVDEVDVEYVDGRIIDVENKVVDITERFNKDVPKNKRELDQHVNNTDKRFDNLEKLQETSVSVISNELSSLDSKLNNLNESLADVNSTIPKIKKEIVSSVTKVEKSLKEEIGNVKNKLEEEITSKEKQLVESFQASLSSNQADVKKINTDLPKQSSRILDVELSLKKMSNEVLQIKTDRTLIEKVGEIKKNVKEIDSVVEENNNKIKHIEKTAKEALDKVSKALNEEKYHAINQRIKYMEEVLNKVNEKTLLNENIYPDPKSKTADPLTSLDQNFVTFEQLKKHYSLFINRVQNSLMAVGGGGAGYLPDLMDVSIGSTPLDGNVLKYVAANAKWEAGVIVTSDQDLNTNNNVTFANLTTTGDVVITGNLSVLGNSTILNTSTIVAEDKNILLANGAASAAIADGAGITVDGAQANIVYLSTGDKWQLNKNLDVQANISATGTITSPFFYSESDIALKENVAPIDNALDKVLNLFGVSFNWKANQAKSIGVIAQDVEKVVPEIVSNSSSGSKTVSYDALIPILIEAVKEQQKQINDLKARLNEKH